MMNDPVKIDVHGRRITESDVRRGMRRSILASCLGVGSFALSQNMPLQMFLEALDAKGTLIGLAQTAMQVALIAQLPGALLARRLVVRKKPWAIISLLSRVLWFLPLLFMVFATSHPVAVAVATVMLVAVSSILGQSVTAFWFSWMADLVPERIRGQFWGSRQSWVMSAFLLSMALAGFILDWFPSPRLPNGSWMGFGLVFLIGAVLGCLDVVIHMAVPEPVIRVARETETRMRSVLTPLRNKDFRALTLAMGFYMFAMGLVSLGVIYLKKDFGVTYSQLAVLAISGSLGTIVSSFAWGYVVDRIGGRAFGAVMVVLAPLLGFCWFFVKDYHTDVVGLCEGIWVVGTVVRTLVDALPAGLASLVHGCVLPQSIWILVFINFFAGILFGGIGLTQLNLSSALLPEKSRTVAMAVHWSGVGLIGAMGPLVGGWVMDAFVAHPVNVILPTGTKLAFHQPLIVVQMVIMWAVVLPLILRIRRGKGEPLVGQAFARLLTTNPIRAVPNIYLLTSAVTRLRKVRAVRRLGEGRTTLAVTDLIEKLDDPSPEVREESALALGSIGSAEAVDALIRKLDDSYDDLDPQVARALRMARDPRSLDVLVRKLKQDADRETKVESARALGALGDSRAIPVLMELVAGNSDIKVITACSEALARLGNVSAVREILPRIRATHGLVFRRSLAVAVGDLIGEPDGFYKILAREQQTRGVEVTHMLHDLRVAFQEMGDRLGKERVTGLVEGTRLLGSAMEDGNCAGCMQMLADMARQVAGLLFDVKGVGDVADLIREVSGRDERFGAGIWCMENLRQSREQTSGEDADHLDVLLGLYFLWHRVVERG